MSLDRYRYIGHRVELIGHTALGVLEDGVFKVQVDCLANIWSHGWHETNIKEWEIIPWRMRLRMGHDKN